MKLLAVFVAVAFVCLPASSHQIRNEVTSFENQMTFQDMQKGLLDDLIKEAQDLLDKLVKTITGNFTKPIKDITDLQKILENIYNESIDIIKKTYIEKEEQFLKDITKVTDCFKEEAKKVGVSLKECVDKTQNQVINIPESFVRNLTQCAVDEYDGAMEIFNEAENIYNGVLKDVSDYYEKIGDCSRLSWYKWPGCFAGLFSDIGSLTVKITTTYVPQVTSLAASLSTYAGGMKLRIIACGSLKTASLGIQCTGITTDFVMCAKDKFKDPTVVTKCLNAY